MLCRKVAPMTVPMIKGSSLSSCLYITSLIKERDETGTAKLQSRFTIIRSKLPTRSQRNGRTSFHISGINLGIFSFGFGSLGSVAAVSSLSHEVRLSAGLRWLKLHGLKEESIR